MHHPARFAAAHVAHEAHGIVISFTGMNNQRQVCFQSRLYMRCKNFLLLGSRGIVVMIIETRFADADDFGIFCVQEGLSG